MIPESGLDIAARRNVRNIRLTLPFRVDTLRPSHRKGMEAWRATFRPDIPTIDRVVELR